MLKANICPAPGTALFESTLSSVINSLQEGSEKGHPLDNYLALLRKQIFFASGET
jgi:hypothetical protein